MPYKCEKIKLPRSLDRRVRVTPEIAENMLAMYQAGSSLHAIAAEFGVDRKTVKRYVIPGYAEEQTEKARRRKYWLEYYDKDYHRASIKQHRRYKRELELVGKLTQ